MAWQENCFEWQKTGGGAWMPQRAAQLLQHKQPYPGCQQDHSKNSNLVSESTENMNSKDNDQQSSHQNKELSQSEQLWQFLPTYPSYFKAADMKRSAFPNYLGRGSQQKISSLLLPIINALEEKAHCNRKERCPDRYCLSGKMLSARRQRQTPHSSRQHASAK